MKIITDSSKRIRGRSIPIVMSSCQGQIVEARASKDNFKVFNKKNEPENIWKKMNGNKNNYTGDT